MKKTSKNLENIRSIMVFDLDGVLCDSAHRFRYNDQNQIDLDHWHNNSTAENITKDRAISDNLIAYQQACNDRSVLCIIATARSWCDHSEKWLIDNLGSLPDYLSARRSRSDNRSNHALKGLFIQNLRNLSHTLRSASLTFYDDTPKNLREFKRANPDAKLIWIKSNQSH